MSSLNDPRPHFRPRAIGVFQRQGRILVSFARDPRTGGRYARTLGGAIEVGEHSADALRREIREELDADIANLRLLGVLENIFTIDGRSHHEIVFVYDADFVDAALYQRAELPVNEAACLAPAVWLPLEAFDEATLPIYPRGLIALLRQSSAQPYTTSPDRP